jgi:hypothetical protein
VVKVTKKLKHSIGFFKLVVQVQRIEMMLSIVAVNVAITCILPAHTFIVRELKATPPSQMKP